EVNRQLCRAKVNLLWSRKEGFNRAIIEGMCAGVPCIMREGFNFGHHYDYINAKTGCFSSERDLPDRILWMIRNAEQFAPRDWVLANMSCQRATAVLNEAIRERALAAGERWTRDLTLKVTFLNEMRYWDANDEERFAPDFDFLRNH